MSVNNNSPLRARNLNELITRFVLGADTINQGLMRIIPNQQKEHIIQRFTTLPNMLEAPVATPVVPNDSMTKDEISLFVGDHMFYDEFNPLRDFEDDFVENWASGGLTDAQLSKNIRAAILETVVDSVQDNIENITWNGDSASPNVWLQRTDGLIKLIENDVTVNVAAPVGVIDSANILDILTSVKNAQRPELLKGKFKDMKFMVSYEDFQILMDAYRDKDIFKGINIMEGDVPTFAGIPVYSCGIPKDKIVLTIASGAKNSNLVASTWMWSDTKGVKIDRLAANSELFFAKVLLMFGVSHVTGEDIAYYKPV